MTEARERIAILYRQRQRLHERLCHMRGKKLERARAELDRLTEEYIALNLEQNKAHGG